MLVMKMEKTNSKKRDMIQAQMRKRMPKRTKSKCKLDILANRMMLKCMKAIMEVKT